MHRRGVLSSDDGVLGFVAQGKRSILRRSSSEPQDRSTRVKFDPLALLLDASLEGEYDLVQRVMYDVSRPLCEQSLVHALKKSVLNQSAAVANQ